MSRRERRAAARAAAKRTCGECAACCYLLTIPSVAKQAGEPCRYQGATELGAMTVQAGRLSRFEGGRMLPGCAIYETRPEECRTYACLWLRGHGPESMRPDRSGLIVDGHGEPATIRAIALEPGVFVQHRATLEALSSHGYRIVYFTPDGADPCWPLRRRLPLLP